MPMVDENTSVETKPPEVKSPLSKGKITHAVSVAGRYKLIHKHAQREIVTLRDGQKDSVTHQGIHLKFTPLGADGIVCYALPGKAGIDGLPRARGRLNIKDTAGDLGMSEKEVIDILKAHPGNAFNGGCDFVLIDSEGQPLVNAPSSVVDQYVREISLEDGTSHYYCDLCNQSIPNAQGAARHKQGSLHEANIKRAFLDEEVA